jgi:hypothetical protein
MLRESNRFVGQVGNLPPIENRRRARPRKFLRRCSQANLNGIHLNVSNNVPKFGFVTNQSIIALVLPEMTSRKAEDSITLPSSESLERLHDIRNLPQRSDQKMDMVCHHNKGVQLEVSLVSILNRFHYDIGNVRLLEKERPSAPVIKNVINGEEGFSGVCCRRKISIGRQTSVQSPGKEYWLTDGMIVRQSTAMKRSHKEKVQVHEKPLTFVGQVGNLPPLEKRQMNRFRRQEKADFESAAGYQPALQ